MDKIIKFKRKIGTSGRSKAITLPMEISEALHIDKGDIVYVYLRNREIVISHLKEP